MLLTGRKQVVIADVTSSQQNLATGDRKKNVTRAKVLAAIVDLVGINTAQVGQVQGFRLTNSVEVDRVQYNGEKYLYCDGILCCVATMSKAKSAQKMLLNIVETNDADIKNAIEEWIDANLSQ